MDTTVVAGLRLLLIVAVAWLIGVAVLWFFQERLLFPASTAPLVVPPPRDGVAFTAADITATDGTAQRFLVVAPPPGRPVIMFFHGNGGRADAEARGLAPFARRGFGIVVAEYRGYAGNPGRPSETALVADAHDLLDWAAARFPGSRFVPWGESLGTGVAVQLAAARPHDVAGVILDAPFTTLAAVAGVSFPWVPVRALIRHPFDTLGRMRRLTMPVLVLHGESDDIVPVAMGRAIHDAAPCPAGAVFLPFVGHMAFWQDRSGAAARAISTFLDTVASAPASCPVGRQSP